MCKLTVYLSIYLSYSKKGVFDVSDEEPPGRRWYIIGVANIGLG